MSTTTRARRAAEVEGVDYHFVDTAEFVADRDAGGFLEWFEVYGDLKGTPRAPVEAALAAGRDVLMRKDVKGALAVKEHYPEAVVVFVKAPSPEEQRRRMLERGESAGTVEARMAEAAAEEAMAARFDAVVVNDDLDGAVERVAAILKARTRPH